MGARAHTPTHTPCGLAPSPAVLEPARPRGNGIQPAVRKSPEMLEAHEMVDAGLTFASTPNLLVIKVRLWKIWRSKVLHMAKSPRSQRRLSPDMQWSQHADYIVQRSELLQKHPNKRFSELDIRLFAFEMQSWLFITTTFRKSLRTATGVLKQIMQQKWLFGYFSYWWIHTQGWINSHAKRATAKMSCGPLFRLPHLPITVLTPKFLPVLLNTVLP